MPGEMRTRVIVVLIGLVFAAGIAAKAARRDTIPIRMPFTSFPMEIDGWRGISQPAFEDDTLAVLGVDDYLARVYFDARHTPVGLYVGYWSSQRQGDAVHSPLNCLPGAGWQTISRTRIPVSENQPEAFEVNRTVVQKGPQRQLVLYWYQSQGRILASEYWSKLFLVADAMRNSRTDGAIVRIMTPIADAVTTSPPEVDAERAATQFTVHLLPLLDGFLPR
jgi:EpsI family protein